ncbi:MAG: cytochrome c [Candidatus Zixiibacteriota bacterium]|nr:MAG: cytochrome c [candidate division Zixibacteria bacterium]
MPLTLENVMILALMQTPVPRDIDLPLPVGDFELKLLLVVLFLVHIFFVNLMVGGSLLSVFFEILGLSAGRYDKLAKKITETITVNKSLAVVLGVGPLLCINLVYTLHFYSANSLTGYAWISIVPLVALAFLLAYIHKYTWEIWTGTKKQLHVLVGVFSGLLFLFVPFIFLSNANLMLFPGEWHKVTGFFSSLRVGNVFPRYFHFLSASLALTGLFLAGWFGRKRYPVEKYLPGFPRAELRRLFYRIAFYLTLAQLAFGPLLLFTLPFEGLSRELFLLILLGILIAVAVLLALRWEIRSPDEKIGRLYIGICFLFSLIVLAMGTGRHVYREVSLAEHKKLVEEASIDFRALETATRLSIEAGYGAGEAVTVELTGERVFLNCAACHAVDRVLAGPSLEEIYFLYDGDPKGIADWARAPGRKRTEFAPMPAFAHLGDEKLRLVADYILEKGGEAALNQ